MDLSQYLPTELSQSNGRHHAEEERKLKEKLQSHAKDYQNLANQLFGKMIYRKKLENSIKNQKTILSKLTQNMTSKTQHQNKLATLVNMEQEKRKALEQKISENTEKVIENQRRVDHFGEYVLKCHDSIQDIGSEIGGLEDGMREYREQEGKLIQLNVELANAETEYSELCNSLKATEMNLAKLEVRHEKYLKDIEYMSLKKQEVEVNLLRHLDEKTKLQKELDGGFYEHRVTDKLDEIQVVLENHYRTMAQVQAEHEDAMKALEKQIKETVEQNEAFQKALTDLDGTINQQLEALDMAKEELELMSSRRFNEMPELKPLLLDLEEKKCQVSQLEEEIMYLENGLGDHNESTQRPPASVLGNADDTERAMTSTPQINIESQDGNTTALTNNSHLSSTPPVRSGMKRSSKQLDGEISSTQD